MLIYATAADLVNNGWMTTTPSNVNALLRQASNLVRDATKADLYWVYPLDTGDPAPSSAAAGTDPGKPTDPDISQAFNDATCQQVLTWSLQGVNPDADVFGQAAIISAQATEGDTVTYVTDKQEQWLEESLHGLCDAAVVILQNAGLMVNRPQLL